MIYALKFGASFILPPGIFIVLLSAVAVWLWRERRRRLAGALGGVVLSFYLLATPWASDALMGLLEGRYAPPEQPSGDVIVLLGGGATSDTPDLDGLGNLSGSAGNRLLTAARLQRVLDVPIIVSGGKVYADTGREAVISRRLLLGLGVPEEKILLDDQSLNTKQNAQFTRRILAERGYARPILVTSAFHMERSVINFAKEDVAVIPFPADYRVSRERAFYFNKLAPSPESLENSCIFFREWLGIVAAKLVK